MNSESPAPDHFRQMYEGQAPWDVGHAQPALVEVAARMQGSVLDVGCGTGDNAIFLAVQGHTVYGIDFVAEAIERAKQKADEQNANVCFLNMDALSLAELPIQFDNIVDCGLFHVFVPEDRERYVQSLAAALKPGGHVWLLCFSDHEPPGAGPHRIAEADLRVAFQSGWNILEITPTRFETSRDVSADKFSDGGPHAYRAVIERQE